MAPLCCLIPSSAVKMLLFCQGMGVLGNSWIWVLAGWEAGRLLLCGEAQGPRELHRNAGECISPGPLGESFGCYLHR